MILKMQIPNIFKLFKNKPDLNKTRNTKIRAICISCIYRIDLTKFTKTN